MTKEPEGQTTTKPEGRPPSMVQCTDACEDTDSLQSLGASSLINNRAREIRLIMAQVLLPALVASGQLPTARGSTWGAVQPGGKPLKYSAAAVDRYRPGAKFRC